MHTSLRALCLLPALALGACDPKLKVGEVFDEDPPAGGSSTGGEAPADSSISVSSAPAPDDATADPPDSGGDDGTGAGPTDGTGQQVDECDLFAQDCPPGFKCAASADAGSNTWDVLRCVPLQSEQRPPGSSCEVTGGHLSGIDNCELGSMCWDPDEDPTTGTCVPQCGGMRYDPECGEGQECFMSNGFVLILCQTVCDPLMQDCEGDRLCVDGDNLFICVADTSGDEGQVFDPCEYVNECDTGLACVPSSRAVECDPAAGTGCCLPFCEVGAPNTCPGAGQECVPWYKDGQHGTPLGQEHIGRCQLAG